MPRIQLQDLGTASLKFGEGLTNTVSAPFTFSTAGFSIAYRYRALGVIQPNDGMFQENGAFSLGRQGSNDFQIYAYLNAPADYASGPRNLRFGGVLFPAMGNYDGNIYAAANQNWHQRVFSLYISSGHAYVDTFEDGILVQSANGVNYTGDTSTPSGNFNIGYWNNGGRGYGQNMADVKIFNNLKFTAQQASDFYFAGINPASPDAWWKLNEGTGTTANDSSGNGNTGTITGATWVTDIALKPRTIVI